MHLRLTLAQM